MSHNTRPLNRQDYKTLTLAALGGALEFYDFIIFVFFAAVVGELFFPADIPEWLRQVQTFGIFAAGYLARPLGGIVMAHFGDLVGRKKMFTLSILLMAVPTLAIGLLPTYASMGILAPLLLLLMRILQGAAIGGEVPVHLPMAPISKQPLEKDTLRPEMSSDEIDRIIRDAYNKVPYAVGLNNHMGSAMTSSLYGMLKVMQALERYNLYFLDSMTIGNSQAMRAAQGTGVKVIKRKVFLDDTQNEADIRVQFNRAVQLARRNGSAIAIGHPHPSTVRVLQQMLPTLPSDITLVRPSDLLNEPQVDTSTPNQGKPGSSTPRNPFRGVKRCVPKHAPEPVYATRFFSVIGESMSQSTLVQYFQHQWQGWGKKA